MERGGIKMRHRTLNINAEKDVAYENWMNLGQYILTDKPRPINHYLNPFYDRVEAKESMENIDYLRKLGAMTKTEHEIWLCEYKKKCNKRRSSGPRTKVINNYLGTIEVYENLKEACEDNDIKYSNLVEVFDTEKTNEVMYKGLIFEKLK